MPMKLVEALVALNKWRPGRPPPPPALARSFLPWQVLQHTRLLTLFRCMRAIDALLSFLMIFSTPPCVASAEMLMSGLPLLIIEPARRYASRDDRYAISLRARLAPHSLSLHCQLPAGARASHRRARTRLRISFTCFFASRASGAGIFHAASDQIKKAMRFDAFGGRFLAGEARGARRCQKCRSASSGSEIFAQPPRLNRRHARRRFHDVLNQKE